MRVDASLHDTIPASILIIDDDMRIIGWNRFSQEVVNGKSGNEMFGVDPFERIHPEDFTEIKKAFLRTLYTGLEETAEFRMYHRNGPPYKWATARAKRSVIDDKPCVVAVVTETTELKRAEQLQEQFQQLQKMELLEQLTGSLAHEFNNLLFGILGNTELIIEQLDDSYQFIDNINDIHNLANRAIILTHQLLAFARKQIANPAKLSLNEEIESLFPILKSSVGDHIQLAWHPSTEELNVHLDPSQLSEILVNLCLNAKDAIAGTGTITIETCMEFVEMESGGKEQPHKEACNYAIISVSDTGCGIDASMLPHIYEPFFSTKKIGHGIGLGLSSVYGVLKQNQGYIDCRTEIGKGTTFRLHLPLHEGTIDKNDAGDQNSLANWRGRTILLVEDEPGLLKMLKGMLKDTGVTLLYAQDANTAIKISDQYPDTIDLLVTDTILPYVSGEALSKQLQGVRPGLRTIFMSGNSQETSAHGDPLIEGLNLIRKPFSLKSFMGIISGMFENRTPSSSLPHPD
jgi:two-component system, cell cycle sensor histidine kinase and response regulator CckA